MAGKQGGAKKLRSNGRWGGSERKETALEEDGFVVVLYPNNI